MTRPLSSVPAGELPALVEQGLPISEYATEVERRREPHYVFNVWNHSPSAPHKSVGAADKPAEWHLEWNRRNRYGSRITHRIRVFLKERA